MLHCWKSHALAKLFHCNLLPEVTDVQSLFSSYIIINYYIVFLLFSYMLVSHFISIVIMYTRKLINIRNTSLGFTELMRCPMKLDAG